MGAVVSLVDVVEHFLAPVVLDVHIDVRRLRASFGADLGEESLEEQAVLHRIDGGDAEAVGDRRVGGAAAALPEDAAPAGELHGIPHHEKESGETEPRMIVELVVELTGLRVRQRCSPALVRARVRPLAEKRVVVVTVGHGVVRKRRAHPAEIELALLGNALALAQVPPFVLATGAPSESGASSRHSPFGRSTPRSAAVARSIRAGAR